MFVETLERRRMLSGSTVTISEGSGGPNGGDILQITGADTVTLTQVNASTMQVTVNGVTSTWQTVDPITGPVPITEVDILATADGRNTVVFNTDATDPITANVDTGNGSDVLQINGTGNWSVAFDGGTGHDFVVNNDPNAVVTVL